MADELKDLLSDVLASPLGDVIASVGEGVADAQRALDESALSATLDLYREDSEALMSTLREIGYRPTFYVLPETTGEVHVSMRISGNNGSNVSMPPPTAARATALRATVPQLTRLRARPRARTYVTPVDAGFANKYAYASTASAKLTFKIVPVPPPSGAEDMRAVPDLEGRTADLVLTALAALDLEVRLIDSVGNDIDTPDPGFVVSETLPPANSIVLAGSELVVTLVPPDT